MKRWLKTKLARFVFWFAKQFCQAELNQVIGDVAMNVASNLSIRATRARMIGERIAVCRHEFCTERFGLRRTANGLECQKHALIKQAVPA